MVLGAVLLIIRAFIVDLEPDIAFRSRDIATQIIAIWGYISCVVIWIWMLSDYFQNSVPSMRRTWGFLLLFGNFVMASIYFFAIYTPRKLRQP